jgi:hypothetical protein
MVQYMYLTESEMNLTVNDILNMVGIIHFYICGCN